MIDWRRMAEPDPDGYDTRMILELLRSEPAPWHAAIPAGPPPHREPAIAGGKVAVRIDGDPLLPAPRFAPLPGIPANLEQAVAYVSRWPAAAAQWPRIVHTIQPFTDTTLPTGGPPRLGSSSHNAAARYGTIALTVDCPLGAAQAIVHEMAHHKLRVMGVDNEAAIRLVANPPDALYMSPVVGIPRPMTAVLHAQYSFIHVTQLDLMMLEGESDPDRRADILVLLGRNVPRMEAGAALLRRHALLDADGEAFMDAFMAWTDRVLDEARRLPIPRSG